MTCMDTNAEMIDEVILCQMMPAQSSLADIQRTSSNFDSSIVDDCLDLGSVMAASLFSWKEQLPHGYSVQKNSQDRRGRQIQLFVY